MAEPPTCGQGLASQAHFPAKLGEVMGCVAAILESHMTALDLRDEASKQEHEVYRQLAHRHRETASELESIADQMAGSSDLAMGHHDQDAMQSEEAVKVFEDFVRVENELLSILQTQAEQHQKMLAEMRGSR